MKLALADTVWGAHIVPFNDLNVGHALLRYGEFSLSQALVAARLICLGDTVLDIGANIGAMALPMMRAAGPTGRVICFEPQYELARLCAATLALNAEDQRQFAVRNVGVGREPGEMHVPPVDYAAEVNNFGCVELAAAGKLPVKIVALDHLDLPRVNFMKIDVEGMESDVIAGAARLIAQDRPVIMVENDREDRYEALIEQVTALGYDCYWLVTPLFNPDNARGDKANIYAEDCGSIDMLCFPEGSPLPDDFPDLPRATKEFAAKWIRFAKHSKR